MISPTCNIRLVVTNNVGQVNADISTTGLWAASGRGWNSGDITVAIVMAVQIGSTLINASKAEPARQRNVVGANIVSVQGLHIVVKVY